MKYVIFLSYENCRTCPKPLKAALQLQVASDSEADVHSIPILAACYLPDLRLKIAYGNASFLTFDSVVSVNNP